MKKFLGMLVLAVVVVSATMVMAAEEITVDGYTLVQGNALNLGPTDLRTDKTVASLGEVVDILDRLWEAGKGKDQPLCVSEGFFRKTEAGWIFTPAIKVQRGTINVVKIPSGDQMMYWIVKRPSPAVKE